MTLKNNDNKMVSLVGEGCRGEVVDVNNDSRFVCGNKFGNFKMFTNSKHMLKRI